jgi:hypothetical protein
VFLVMAGMVWPTRITPESGYASALLGPLLITGVGTGLAISPSMNTAAYRLPPADAGVGSALANTQQQIGRSIGTALLNTLAVAATTGHLTTHASAGMGARVVTLAARSEAGPVVHA